MKKLLAAGFDKIYQLCRVFRDDPEDDLHLKEFTMLEWYCVGKDYRWLIEFTLELLGYLSKRWDKKEVHFRDRKASLEGIYEVFSFEKAFQARFSVSIKDLDSLETLVELAKSYNIPFDERSWENTFHLIYLNCFEPEIARKEVPVFVIDYPSKMAAMAKLRKDKPWLAERVELMICGVELMNGYSELNDQKEQYERLLRESLKAGLTEKAVDEDFIEAVAQMPDAAGAALGIERLFMLFEGKDSIKEVTVT